jgi:hypothetical protein
MTHSCIPSYSGGEDWEDLGSRPAQAKVIETLSPSNKKLGVVVHTVIPAKEGV